MFNIFHERKIDVAFVDIRMPGIDGLTAIDQCKAIQPKTHFYILTGYSEFEYAHKALQLHIEDYLLKPVSPGQIHSILEKEQAYIQTTISQMQNFYVQILSKSVNNQNSAPVNIPAVLVCFSGEMVADKFQEATNRICRYLEQELRLTIIKCSFLCWEFIIIQQTTDFIELKRATDSVIRQLPCCAFLQYNSGRPSTSLQTAQLESMQMILAPYGCCRTSLDEYKSYLKLGAFFTKLLYWSSEKNFDQFHLISSQFVTVLSQQHFSSNEAEKHFISIMNHFFSSPHNKAGYLVDIPLLLNIYAANHLLCSVSGSKLDSIKQYINTHYQKKVTLPMLAQKFGYTPNYISTAFRNQTGKTIIQYLNQVRLFNSCKLLAETSLSIQEIAESVGYSDSNYYTRMFTQQYQCTPSNYRKNTCSPHSF